MSYNVTKQTKTDKNGNVYIALKFSFVMFCLVLNSERREQQQQQKWMIYFNNHGR